MFFISDLTYTCLNYLDMSRLYNFVCHEQMLYKWHQNIFSSEYKYQYGIFCRCGYLTTHYHQACKPDSLKYLYSFRVTWKCANMYTTDIKMTLYATQRMVTVNIYDDSRVRVMLIKCVPAFDRIGEIWIDKNYQIIKITADNGRRNIEQKNNKYYCEYFHMPYFPIYNRYLKYFNVTDMIKYYKLPVGWFKYDMLNKWQSGFIYNINDIPQYVRPAY